MSDEDGFEEQESRPEAWVFIGSLAMVGLMALVAGLAGSWKWLKSWL